jgi:hypothetical protein
MPLTGYSDSSEFDPEAMRIIMYLGRLEIALIILIVIAVLALYFRLPTWVPPLSAA